MQSYVLLRARFHNDFLYVQPSPQQSHPNAGVQTSTSGAQPDAADMAAQLQGLLSQMGNISSNNPFAGLFTGLLSIA